MDASKWYGNVILEMETSDLRVGTMDSSFQKRKEIKCKNGAFELFLDDQSCDDLRLRMNVIKFIVFSLRTSRGNIYDTFYRK